MIVFLTLGFILFLAYIVFLGLDKKRRREEYGEERDNDNDFWFFFWLFNNYFR